jgi:NADPH:quinone reductase-like Zn-dependent oxidoreductase
MKAVTFSDYGGPEVLGVTDVDEPHADPGQIRIAVRAAGVNPIDCKARSGAMREMMPLSFPAVDGREAAGVVDEVGEGVSGVAPGDEVFGFAVGGAAAEYAVLDDFARKPAALSFEEAAALPVAVETSVRVFGVLGGVGEGQTLVVNGAAGGVGVAAVQLARERGARVIGTASERNHDFLRSLGAQATTYGEGLADRVRALGGADLAFDAAGFGALPDLIAITGSPDNVISIADGSGPELGVRVTGGDITRALHGLTEAARLWEAGRFSLPVERTFTFADAAEAQRLSEAGHVRGKLVLVPL